MRGMGKLLTLSYFLRASQLFDNENPTWYNYLEFEVNDFLLI